LRYDLAVIGAGIVGLVTAYYYTEKRGGRVLVIDENTGPAQGNTARSVGGFRLGLFTSRLNRVVSESSVRFYLDLQSAGYDLGIQQVGYLVLLDDLKYSSYIESVRELISAGKALLVSSDELRKALPFINLDLSDEEAQLMGLRPIKGAIFSPKSGYLDVEKLAKFYYEKLVERGVEFLFNTRVERLVLSPVISIGHPREPLTWQEKRIGGIATSRGLFEADVVVLAVGAWSQELLDPLGIDSHIKPKKRQIFSIPARGRLQEFFNVERFNEFRCIPMTFVPRGPYVVPRVREKTLWLGMSDDIGRKWGIDFEAEDHFYIDNIYPLLSKIFPILEGARPESKWAGCYSINTIDENPVVFRVMNLVVATGGSGSGVMKADAIGRIAAAQALNEPVAELYGGLSVSSDILSIAGRQIEPEKLVF